MFLKQTRNLLFVSFNISQPSKATTTLARNTNDYDMYQKNFNEKNIYFYGVKCNFHRYYFLYKKRNTKCYERKVMGDPTTFVLKYCQ